MDPHPPALEFAISSNSVDYIDLVCPTLKVLATVQYERNDASCIPKTVPLLKSSTLESLFRQVDVFVEPVSYLPRWPK